MKSLRQSKNWTQQHLAEVCGLSMRTIQRIEKDGVASNETVAAYAAVFEIDAARFLISESEFDKTNRVDKQPDAFSLSVGLLMLGVVTGFGMGVGLTLVLF